jgi:WD40 repeat protein
VLVQLSAPADQSDTVLTTLPGALIVEVHDANGALAPAGTVVRFTSAMPDTVPELGVGALATSTFAQFATASTDQSGRASVFVKLGTIAGTAHLEIAVPTLGLTDTALYTVRPGNLAGVTIAPSDTTITIGKSFTYRVTQTDQFGNPRSEHLTPTISDSGASISPSGEFSAIVPHRYTVSAEGVRVTRYVSVSVVPPMRLAGVRSSVPPMLEAFDADGSNRRPLATLVNGSTLSSLAWMPGGASVIYATSVNSLQQLYVSDTAGVAKPFLRSPPATMANQTGAIPSANGQWVYFTANDSRCLSSEYCLFRSHIDGSSPELVSAFIRGYTPYPSPDGSKLLVTTAYGIQVFDVASHATSDWSVPGDSPVWSPDGKQIAFISLNGPINIVNSDGTGVRSLYKTVIVSSHMSWTADSRYVLALPYVGSWALFDSHDDSRIPLPLLAGYSLLVAR